MKTEGYPVNNNVERARAVWRTCRLQQGGHYPEFCAALKRSPWTLDLRVALVSMEVLVSLKEGTVYGCIYADTVDRFIVLIRDDLPLEHQDLVVFHEADHAILGDVVPDFPGDLSQHLSFRMQWREDWVVTPQEVGADEFAREIHRLTLFGLPEAEQTMEASARDPEERGPIGRRVRAFHRWARR